MPAHPCPFDRDLACPLGNNDACATLAAAEDLKVTLEQFAATQQYVLLLTLQRFAASGCPLFAGTGGVLFLREIAARKLAVGDAAHTAASKQIGWKR